VTPESRIAHGGRHIWSGARTEIGAAPAEDDRLCYSVLWRRCVRHDHRRFQLHAVGMDRNAEESGQDGELFGDVGAPKNLT
jgi:hypothetical protein